MSIFKTKTFKVKIRPGEDGFEKAVDELDEAINRFSEYLDTSPEMPIGAFAGPEATHRGTVEKIHAHAVYRGWLYRAVDYHSNEVAQSRSNLVSLEAASA